MLFSALPLFFVVADDATRLDPITIHASLRDATDLEIATSLAVIDREKLNATGVSHFADVMEQVPNLNWSSATSRPRFFQIRGIGERSQYEGAPNPSVGFVIDDIDFSALGTAATLFDAEQVEVLRGPQGTRYGANALAGLIYVKTTDPSSVPEHHLQAIAGDDGAFGLGYAGGGPLSDNANYRVAVQQYEQDGFRSNPFLGRDDTNGRDELTARAKLRWQPGDDWQVDLTAISIDIDNGFDAFVPDNSLTVHSDKPGRDAQDSDALAIKLGYSGFGAAELTSVTTWADSDVLYSFDGDWGNDDFWGEFAPYDFTSETDRRRRNLSQEIRLTSHPDAALMNGSVDWLVGLYVLDIEEDNQFLDFFNGDVFRNLASDFSATTSALFGQVDYRTINDSTITAGLRIERREADYLDSAGVGSNPSETMVGGQLSWSKEVAPGQHAFVTASRGFKAGGFNLGLSIPESRREYDAEYLWNLEAGIRGSLLGGDLRLNANAFYARRDDVQIGTSFQVDPTDPLTFVFFTDNAASGDNYGLELDASWRINDNLQLEGSLGLLETEFNGFDTPERALDGRDQAHAPGYQFALAAHYRADNGWFGRVDVTGKDDFYYSDSHDQQSDAYETVNLRIGYETARWSIAAYARNLTDEVYGTRGFFFGVEPPDFPNRLYIQRGDPRQVGVIFDWRF